MAVDPAAGLESAVAVEPAGAEAVGAIQEATPTPPVRRPGRTNRRNRRRGQTGRRLFAFDRELAGASWPEPMRRGEAPSQDRLWPPPCSSTSSD